MSGFCLIRLTAARKTSRRIVCSNVARRGTKSCRGETPVCSASAAAASKLAERLSNSVSFIAITAHSFYFATKATIVGFRSRPLLQMAASTVALLSCAP